VCFLKHVCLLLCLSKKGALRNVNYKSGGLMVTILTFFSELLSFVTAILVLEIYLGSQRACACACVYVWACMHVHSYMCVL
jgi:hypothetical protein